MLGGDGGGLKWPCVAVGLRLGQVPPSGANWASLAHPEAPKEALELSLGQVQVPKANWVAAGKGEVSGSWEGVKAEKESVGGYFGPERPVGVLVGTSGKPKGPGGGFKPAGVRSPKGAGLAAFQRSSRPWGRS